MEYCPNCRQLAKTYLHTNELSGDKQEIIVTCGKCYTLVRRLVVPVNKKEESSNG